MKLPVIRALLAATLALAFPALAEQALDKAQEDKLRDALKNPTMGLQVESIKPSEIPGLYEVQYERGPLVYATADGAYFVVGDLYSTAGDDFVNVTEKRRDVQRQERMAGVAKDDMIIFSPKGETKAYINVFTDITCGYCRKLHQEVPELNRRGVEVRYLAYPRAGVGTPGYSQLVTAWCADNKQSILTQLKNGVTVPPKSCSDNPVAEQFALGQEVGVRGTPAIVTQDGILIPGYQAADQLMVTLGLE